MFHGLCICVCGIKRVHLWAAEARMCRHGETQVLRCFYGLCGEKGWGEEGERKRERTRDREEGRAGVDDPGPGNIDLHSCH